MIDFDSQPTDKDPQQIIASMDHVRRHHDSQILIELMHKISGSEPVVWGDKSIGFGEYHYIYKTGREGIWPIFAFTPSRENISIHIMKGLESYEQQIKRIGKCKRTETTLILHKFSDIKLPALKEFLSVVYADQKAS